MMIHTPTKHHRLLEMQFPAECHQSVSLFTIAHHEEADFGAVVQEH